MAEMPNRSEVFFSAHDAQSEPIKPAVHGALGHSEVCGCAFDIMLSEKIKEL